MNSAIVFDQTNPNDVKVLWKSKGSMHHVASIINRQFKRKQVSPNGWAGTSHWLSLIQGNAAIKALRKGLIGPG